jgi:uncharacterized protein (TIGR02246 family)
LFRFYGVDVIDEDAIRATLAEYVDAWHRNDMDVWGELFTADCDFITNTALWWKGRDENVAEHKSVAGWIHAEKPKYQLSVADVVALADGVALVHAWWEWPGFADPSASRPIDRAGHITMVMTKQTDGRWLIRASQNTNLS